MENRGDVQSGCKAVLLRNSGRNSGVRALGTDSGRTGTVWTLELNSGCTGRTGRSEGASDACVFFADAPRIRLDDRISGSIEYYQSWERSMLFYPC